MLVCASFLASAQADESVYIGFIVDARCVQAKGAHHQPPSWGGGIGIIGMYNVSPLVSLFGSLQPITAETAKISFDGFVPTDPNDPMIRNSGTMTTSRPGTELSGSVLLRPIRKDKFSIVGGTGVSVRSLWGSDNAYDLYTHRWNFRLPLQTGIELSAGPRCKILVMAEYQVGLRKIVIGSYRSDTFGLKFIAMWPKPRG